MAENLARLASATDERCVIALVGRVTADNARVLDGIIASLRKEHPEGTLVLDAGELEYISSAGLRVVMRLVKAEGNLVIENASPEVYDVFEMTGLTELLDVIRALREISLEGATLLGRGGNGEVWRLDAETVAKVYNEGCSLDKIEAENRQATAAFTSGLPCAIAFDTVAVGNRYGIVFELLDAHTVGNVVHEDPSRIPEMGRKMGELLRELHSTHESMGVLPTINEKMAGWIDYLEEHYLSGEDADLLREVISAVPVADTLLHLDFHEGNVMCQDGELVLIDLDDVCSGNPLFDLINHFTGHVLASETSPDAIRLSMGMDTDEVLAMYRQTLKTYFDTEDDAVLAAHEQKMRLFIPFSTLIFLAKSRDSRNLTPERVQAVLDQVLPVFRSLQPQIVALAKTYL